jgi:hypothetical protein
MYRPCRALKGTFLPWKEAKKKKIKHRLDVSLQGLLSSDAHGMIAQKRSCEAVL